MASAEQRFGLTTLTAIVIANMIGAGVFTTSGFTLAALHTPQRVLAAWLIGGVLALCGALSYGALARRITGSGGEYLFLSRAVHPAAGFVAGWVSLLAGFTGAIAFAAHAFEAYLLPLISVPAGWPAGWLAVTVIVLAGFAHGVTARPGAVAQNVLVGVKFALLCGIVVYAFAFAPATAWQGGPLLGADGDVAPLSWSALALSVMWISLSYSGFNAAVYVAGEVAQARRLVPRALLLGTLLVTALYLALNAVFVYVPAPALIAGSEDVAAHAAHALGGRPLANLVRLVIALALLTSVSSMIMIGPRVYAQMAADGVLPHWFHKAGQVPRRAVALQVVLAVLVVMIAKLEVLLSYLGFTLTLSTALTVASLFVLRARDGAVRVPVPGYPWVPGFYVVTTLACALLAAAHRPLEALVGLLTIGCGLLAWRCSPLPPARGKL
ncbi:MAG: APC family permease [Gammaproteobacteria bacterium]